MAASELTLAPPSALMAFWYSFRENRGAVIGAGIVGFVILCAILASAVAPYDPLAQFREFTKLPPVWVDGGTWKFPLGTDPLGRDMLSRLLYGSRISLFVGLSIMIVCAFIGTCLALLAASVGGIVDIMIMRLMDLILAIPDLVLAILIIAVIGPNLINTIIAITIVYLPRFVILVRATALGELSKDYVTAAKVSGVGAWRLMFTTVLPNCVAPLIIQAALGVSDAILEAAALGFLGLGAQPPQPEWGSMLADTRDLITSNPWVMAMPGIAILITVLAINLMGDGLRDALDPRLRRS